MNRRSFVMLSAAILLLALGLREWFVLTAIIPHPNQGDVGAYLRYALHLVWDGVFTQASNGMPAVADAYRSPGYPWLLAGTFKVVGMDRWHSAVYQVQVVLGVATVAGVIALAREWLSRGWALLAGLLLAVQPHHIAATGALLTEVLFGLCIVVGLFCTARAMRTKSWSLAVLAGIAFGYGYLVNPVIALFPVVLVPLLWRTRQGAVMLLVSLLAVGGWSLRNHVVSAPGGDRAVENFVQGAWPTYHESSHVWMWFPENRAVMDGIKVETATLKSDRAAGLSMIAVRLFRAPWRYARWYAVEKPYLLWDWSIRMGKGGIYQIGVSDSPLEHPPLLGIVILLWALNPALFALMLAGIWRARGAGRVVAMFAVYITVVHVVFQAEPRYAIAYRGVEAIMAMAGLALGYRAVSRRTRGRARDNEQRGTEHGSGHDQHGGLGFGSDQFGG
jgi:4-amino-4-deoxy-L-arabinose transferase-like glycosyltransferase